MTSRRGDADAGTPTGIRKRVCCALVAASLAVPAFAGTMCDDISSVPVQYVISYQAAVQGLFNNFDGTTGCVDCHFAIADGPSGNLDLTPGPSWSNLYKRQSNGDSTLYRVIPNYAYASVLFDKVNCQFPEVGSRMPYQMPPLTLQQQALIYDWIASGAWFDTSNTLFRSSFGDHR